MCWVLVAIQHPDILVCLPTCFFRSLTIKFAQTAPEKSKFLHSLTSDTSKAQQSWSILKAASEKGNYPCWLMEGNLPLRWTGVYTTATTATLSHCWYWSANSLSAPWQFSTCHANSSDNKACTFHCHRTYLCVIGYLNSSHIQRSTKAALSKKKKTKNLI